MEAAKRAGDTQRVLRIKKTEKAKGLLSHFVGSPRNRCQAPSKEEIKRQNNLRGTSTAAIAEMSQKGVFKIPSPTSAGSATVLPSSPKATSEPMFGRDLAAVCQEDCSLPVPVQMIMAALRADNGLRTEGIFRVSGSGDDISRLIVTINECWRKPGAQRDGLLEGADLHTLSGTFKQFWRKLPEPLFPFSMYGKLVQASDEESIIASLRELPPLRRTVANTLFSYLAGVAALQEVNLMSPMNLSICFAPNLVRPQQETMESIINDTPKIIAVVGLFIQHFLEEPDSDASSDSTQDSGDTNSSQGEGREQSTEGRPG